MAQSNLDTEIRACIDSFVGDLTVLIHRAALESVQEAIGSVGAPARRGPGRPRKARAKAAAPAAHRGRKRIRRSSANVDATAAAAAKHIGAHAGCTVGEIGAALGLTSKDLRLPLQKLLAEKAIKTTGQKRGTRYHPGSGGRRKKKATKRKTSGKAGKRKAARRKRTTPKKRATKKG